MKDSKHPLVKKNIHKVFESSSYLQVIGSIKANIRSNTGLIVLTGEPGTGKTLVIRKVLKDLGGVNYTVFLNDPRYTIDEMLSSACEQIGVALANLQNDLEVENQLKIFYEYLEERSQEKGSITFFIDDAQNVSSDTLFNILKLLQERPDTNRPLQVILIGLPQLETLLDSPKLFELKTASPVYLRLKPLDTEEVGAFVTQCLNASGIKSNGFLSLEAVARIALYTRGIPSLVRILFDSIMFIMNSNQDSGITVDIVDEAVDFFSHPWAAENKNFRSNTTRYQEKADFDKSMQVSSSSEKNKIGKKTLISEIRGKVTDLFSQKKIVNNESAPDHRDSENNFEDEVEIFEAFAGELQHHDRDQNVGEFEIPAKNSGDLVETTTYQDFNNESEPSIRQPIQILQTKQVETMKEETMNRGEQLNKVLKTLQSGSPDVEAVALISEDGLIVASALPQDLDEIRVGGMSATLLSLGTRSSAELRRGKVEEIIVRGEQGYTVMLNAGRGTLLLVVANENAKLGLIFFDMHETVEKIADIL